MMTLKMTPQKYTAFGRVWKLFRKELLMKPLVKKLLNRLPMRRKLLLSFSLVICIPLLVSLYLMQSMKNNVMDTAVKDGVNSMDRVDIKLSQIFDSIDSISSEIAYSEGYFDLLTASYENEFDRVSMVWSSADLSEYISLSNGNIGDIRYYVDSVPVLDNGYFTNTPDSIRKSAWYRNCQSGLSVPFWTYLESPRFMKRGSHSLTFIRPVYYKQRFFAILTLYVNQEKMNEILALEHYQTFLLSPENTIVASSDPAQIGSSLADIGLTQQDGNYRTLETFYDPGATILSRTLRPAGSSLDFHIISVLPTDMILEKVSETSQTSGIIVAVAVILSFLFLILFSDLLTHRLSRLQSDIHRAAGGDFSFHPVAEGTDEIARLSTDFEKMLDNIQDLINKVYIAQIQKQTLETKQKEIKLQVLNSQINPHFLFNALESIRMKAVSKEQQEIGSAIRMLSSLLRKSLYAGSSPIPLADELELVTNYLELQKFRFPDGFEYKILTLCDISGQLLPPFTLQPLAENCFRHGFESLDSPHRNNFVTITVMQEETFLLIRIADNGGGMDARQLAALTDRLKEQNPEPESSHIGICNVHQRIRLIYGQEYGLGITSMLHKGCVLTIRLPYQQTIEDGS